jgi:hypothetical protein
MRHIITISGKDSAAACLTQLARKPELPYEFVFCDVKMELPETYAWLDKFEKALDIKIVRIGKSLEDVIVEQNMLPSAQRRFCTRLGKVFPARDFIGGDEAIQYFGIRADEADRMAGFTGMPNITPRYPLVECGIDLPAVYTILGHRGILPPEFFWQRLYDAVWKRLEDTGRELVRNLKPWERAFLFAWRSRANCYMCFYQRRYEWVGLLEHHPNLFDEAERIESNLGSGDRRDESFFWIKDAPLQEIRRRAQEIFAKRVKKVCKIIHARLQGQLWQNEVDELATTSCGLYCGK